MAVETWPEILTGVLPLLTAFCGWAAARLDDFTGQGGEDT